MKEKNAAQEQRILKEYQAKIKREAALKSAVLALIVGFFLSLIVSVISYVTLYNALWISLSVWLAAAIGFFMLFYKKVFRVSLKTTAARVDTIGLDERVITMVDLAGSEDFIARKQRENTQAALSAVSPRQLKTFVSKLSVLALSLIAFCSIFMMTFSTVRAEDYQPPVVEQSYEDKIIQDMIDDLREIISEAEISQELKDKLNQMVDDLEASIKPTDSTEVKIAKVSETSQKIHSLLQAELSKTTIAEQLKKHDTTKTLGKAIGSGDPTKIDEAFDMMYDKIVSLTGQQKYDELIQTGTDIKDSLKKASDIKKGDPLYEALDKLADAFLNIPVPPPMGGDDQEMDDAVQDAIDDAKDAIKDAIEDQGKIEDTDDAIQDSMNDAMENMGKEDNEGDEEGDNQGGEDEEKPGDDEGEENNGGPQHPTEDGEIIYDAIIDGETPYMDVYEEYYEKAMELLASGTLSDEMRQVIENYFKILS